MRPEQNSSGFCFFPAKVCLTMEEVNESPIHSEFCYVFEGMNLQNAVEERNNSVTLSCICRS